MVSPSSADVTGQLACAGCGRQTKLGRETAAALEDAQKALVDSGMSLEIVSFGLLLFCFVFRI